LRVQKGFHEPGEKPRRFYKAVEVRSTETGHAVLLDGRGPSSAGGKKLVLPTPALAQLCADEWAAQGEFIELAAMSATRLAYTALEAIPPVRGPTADQFADYAGSDLICYFAEEPMALVVQQTKAWEPILERAETELGLIFIRAKGIRHRTQPEGSLEAVRDLALGLDDFGLAGLAFGAPLLGSAILTLALQRGWVSGEEAHHLCRVDEAFQESKWGIDEEAAIRTAGLLKESQMLAQWFAALR
jgi:chaperone required for assembly of F1-ATPase